MGMPPWVGHLRLLVWKNFKLQWRRPKGTAAEILLPTLFILILVFVRMIVPENGVQPAEAFCSKRVLAADYVRRVDESQLGLVGGTSTDTVRGCSNDNPADSEEDFFTSVFEPCDSNAGANGGECGYTAIAFVPNTTHATQVMTTTLELVRPAMANRTASVSIQGFDSVSDLNGLTSSEDPKFLAAFVFEQIDTSGSTAGLWVDQDTAACPTTGPLCTPRIHVQLRFPESFQAFGESSYDGWQTDRTFKRSPSPGPDIYGPYFNGREFFFFEAAVQRALTIFFHPTGLAPIGVPRIKAFPFPEYDSTQFVQIVSGFLGTFIVLTYLYTALSITRGLVEEKQARLKEAMKMMGLTSWVHWAAWFIKYFLFMMMSVTLIAVMLVFGRIFENSDFSVIWVLLVLYASSTITFCFLLSTFFDSANTAAAAGGLLYFVAFIPSYLAPQLDASQRTAACLLGPSCLGFGIDVIARHEIAGQGQQWSNLDAPADELDPFNMATVFGMLVVDTLLYFCLAWYIEKVLPGQYGIAQPPWFILLPSFWCGSSRRRAPSPHAMNKAMEPEAAADFECPPDGLRAGVDIVNLRKIFHVHGQTKVAVDNLSLSLYEDQVTVLLGHNGAGKSTTMSVMVGLYAPTSGTVVINGHDITEDTNAARRSLGLCPQFDVLWPTLTVEEHLLFFGRLKGLSGRALRAEVDSLIEDMDLKSKRHAASKTLSGGQKRALSVGIAFIGGSEVVVLDEPTSGMDPQKRRHTWDVIIKHKKGRTILLTTHFLDEADLLGDRVAILSSGRLQACGRSDFLKKRFGVGYHLTMVKDAICDTSAVIEFLRQIVPETKLEDDLGAEITCLVPTVPLSVLATLIGNIETNQVALGIDSFGVQVSTLEEVFLNLGKGESGTFSERRSTIKAHRKSLKSPVVQTKDCVGVQILGGPANLPEGTAVADTISASLRARQFRALVTKRALHSMRHLRNVIPQILLPVIFALAALAVSDLIEKEYENAPCRALDLDTSQATYLVSAQDTAGDYRTGAVTYIEDSLAEIGDRTQTASIAGLAASAQGQVRSTSEDVSSTNLTAILLNRAQDFVTNGFFTKNFGASSFEQGSFSLTAQADVCALNRGGTAQSNVALTLHIDTLHYFHLANDAEDDAELCIVTSPVDTNCGQVAGFSKVSEEYYSWVTSGLTTSSTFFYRCNFSQTSNASPIVFTDSSAAVSDPSTYTALAWFSTEAIHASAESLAFAGQAVARESLGGEAVFSVANCPLPQDAATTITNLQQDMTGFQIATFMLLAFTFLAASFVVAPVEERISLAKHVQFVSGVNSNTYWFANLAWDFINISVSIVFVVVVFVVYGTPAYTGSNLLTVIVVLTLFGFAILPFVYLLSRQFQSSSSAYAKLCVGFVLVTFGSLLTVVILRLPGLGYSDESRILKYIFFCNPVFAVCIALYDMYTNALFLDYCTRDATLAQECTENNIHPQDSSLAWEDHPYGGVAKNCLALTVTGCLYLVALLIVESGRWEAIMAQRSRSTGDGTATNHSDEDADVAVVRDEVMKGSRDKDPVVVSGLTKVYEGKKAAVSNLCFSVRRGECFGLLGVNGAGKTSTFKMLTGECHATRGRIHVLGMELMANLSAVRRHCGYCPQFGGLIPTLTGREHLRMFARLRGIEEEHVPAVVAALLTNLNLNEHADRPAGTYSGGNKRKLSTAIALTGDPDVVFLDEPTTGMDPGARRHLWSVVSRAVQAGRSIVLTSHSMEECEALATNLAIMKDGRFRCIGSAQQLRSKFGEGFMLTMRCAKDSVMVPRELKRFTFEVFPNTILVEEHDRTLSLQIPKGPTWAEMFVFLQQAVEVYELEDHSLSQPSLESVFIRLVSDADTPAAAPPGAASPSLLPTSTTSPRILQKNVAPPTYNAAPAYVVTQISDL